jgi:hypothetical protein
LNHALHHLALCASDIVQGDKITRVTLNADGTIEGAVEDPDYFLVDSKNERTCTFIARFNGVTSKAEYSFPAFGMPMKQGGVLSEHIMMRLADAKRLMRAQLHPARNVGNRGYVPGRTLGDFEFVDGHDPRKGQPLLVGH